MKQNKTIRCLRIWSPDSARIRQKFVLKDELLFGSDRSADIRMPETAGLFARLDFKTSELHFLESDRFEKLEVGQIFQIGERVFQWQEIRLFRTEFLKPTAYLLAGLLLIAVAYALKPKVISPTCSERANKMLDGHWRDGEGDPVLQELHDQKKSFQMALRKKEWMKARSELNSIEATLEAQTSTQCPTLGHHIELEAQLSKALIVDHLKSANPQLAAEEIRRFESRFKSDDLNRMYERVIRSARKLYYEGYRLEDSEPSKGADLMEQAEEICTTLGRDAACFRVQAPPVAKKEGSRIKDEDLDQE